MTKPSDNTIDCAPEYMSVNGYQVALDVLGMTRAAMRPAVLRGVDQHHQFDQAIEAAVAGRG